MIPGQNSIHVRTSHHRSGGAGTVELAPGLRLTGFAMNFARDEEIYGEGETADFVYRVVSGTVRISRLLDDGRRQITAFCFPGDVFGLETGDMHGGSAESVTACEIALVSRTALGRATSADASAASVLLGLACRQLARAQEHMIVLGRKNATERVVQFLADLAAQIGRGESVRLPMSRLDIADYLGLTIETVSRTLAQLDRQGAIRLRGSREVTLSEEVLASQASARLQ
ncbi:MAG: helix-turn-helix domain-containing protein [Alphaproteobacteria bacterium]|nr:helix-turn-helix domain-containing protein [Alphaproteobacteria bacterium]